MPLQPTRKIEKLRAQLQERLDRLVSAMQGNEVSQSDLPLHSRHEPHRFVRADDVRVAIDDFSTILKETKATLGKR